MEVTAVILYKDAFAYYSVSQEANFVFSAHLFSYSGDQGSRPPAFVRAQVLTESIEGNIDDVLLMEDILRAARFEQKRKQTVLSFPQKVECILPAINRWF